MILDICPFCGGHMKYSSIDYYNFCDTCFFIIRDDGSRDFSEMDEDYLKELREYESELLSKYGFSW